MILEPFGEPAYGLVGVEICPYEGCARARELVERVVEDHGGRRKRDALALATRLAIIGSVEYQFPFMVHIPLDSARCRYFLSHLFHGSKYKKGIALCAVCMGPRELFI